MVAQYERGVLRWALALAVATAVLPGVVGRDCDRDDIRFHRDGPVMVPEHCDALLALYSGDPKIGPARTKFLGESLEQTKVTKLGLAGNAAGDAGAAGLAAALPRTKVRWVELSNNYVGDEGAIALAEAVQTGGLSELYLRVNNIGDAGAEALAQSIEHPDNELTVLVLGGNYIADGGAQALAKAIESPHCKLTKLTVSTNRLGLAGVAALEQANEGPSGAKIEQFDISSNYWVYYEQALLDIKGHRWFKSEL